MSIIHEFYPYRRQPFDSAKCTACGKCLSSCPVLHLPECDAPDARRALSAAARGDSSDPLLAQILERCTSCFACNYVCPSGCDPANLILDLWHQQCATQGLPARARYFLPHGTQTFRTHVVSRLPDDERAAVESWQSLEPLPEFLFAGCNLITAPYLTFSRLFDGIAIRGNLSCCCGEMYWRMGLYRELELCAKRATEYLRILGAKRLYFLCTACLNLFTHVLPQFGADFSGIELRPYLKVLHDRVANGSLHLDCRFDGQAAVVQDSCHSKLYDPQYWRWPRRLLELMGFTIVEPAQFGNASLCCGIGAGFSPASGFDKLNLIRGQRACLRNLTRPRADLIAVYCAGCLQMLSVGKYTAWTRRPVYHVTELLQLAIGETPRRRQAALARDFLWGTLTQQSTGSARFFLDSVPEGRRK